MTKISGKKKKNENLKLLQTILLKSTIQIDYKMK